MNGVVKYYCNSQNKFKTKTMLKNYFHTLYVHHNYVVDSQCFNMIWSIDNSRLPDENITAGHELRKQLLKNYDKVVVPATNKKLVHMKVNTVFNSIELVKFIL